MKSFAFVLVAAASAVFLLAAPGGARADDAWDVEAARANARAGGPLSEHDRWLLDRYGALSGTPGYSPGGTYRLRSYSHRRGRRSLSWDWRY